jgi:hypothetical protein
VKVTIVASPENIGRIEVVKEPSIYAPSDYVYFVPSEMDFLQMAKTMASLENQRDEWIRRYDNLMRGLQYWRERALEQEEFVEKRNMFLRKLKRAMNK